MRRPPRPSSSRDSRGVGDERSFSRSKYDSRGSYRHGKSHMENFLDEHSFRDDDDEDEDDRTFKTAQYVQVLKQILKDKNVDLSTFDNMTIDSRAKGIPSRSSKTNKYEQKHTREARDIENETQYTNDETQYEYHLELQRKGTEISSITDTVYSMSSRKQQNGRKVEKAISKQSMGTERTPIRRGNGPQHSAAKAAASILSAGGSFDSAVKTVSTIMKERNKLRHGHQDENDDKSIKSSSSFFSRASRNNKKSYHSSDATHTTAVSTVPDESVQAWATVAVSAAASVLDAGGSRASAQAASAAVLSTGSRSQEEFDGPAGIAAAAEASAAVLATGSDQASATAAAITILRVSQSFASKPTPTPTAERSFSSHGGQSRIPPQTSRSSLDGNFSFNSKLSNRPKHVKKVLEPVSEDRKEYSPHHNYRPEVSRNKGYQENEEYEENDRDRYSDSHSVSSKPVFERGRSYHDTLSYNNDVKENLPVNEQNGIDRVDSYSQNEAMRNLNSKIRKPMKAPPESSFLGLKQSPSSSSYLSVRDLISSESNEMIDKVQAFIKTNFINCSSMPPMPSP